MKKPRPTIEKMRDTLINFEIEEVYYSKDYQAMVEEDHCGPEGPINFHGEEWKSEEDIVEYYMKEDPEEIESLWDEGFNQYLDYEEKKNED